MSDRAARAARRTEQRQRERAVLRAADPGRHDALDCLVTGCDRRGVPVQVGPLGVSLCVEHKARFDAEYDRAASGARRPTRQWVAS